MALSADGTDSDSSQGCASQGGAPAAGRMDAAAISRSQVEDFLYHEAALLDAWQLQEWLALCEQDVTYRVPAAESRGDGPHEALFLIADDAARLRGRVARLLDPHAHAEFPHSRTRRLITNVRIVGRDGDVLDVEANFAVHRFRRGDDVRTYVGGYRYRLRATPEGLRIAAREAVLDAEELGALGLVSIIV
jgi:p-cumate 2,3-dioxygenase beta subunit